MIGAAWEEKPSKFASFDRIYELWWFAYRSSAKLPVKLSWTDGKALDCLPSSNNYTNQLSLRNRTKTFHYLPSWIALSCCQLASTHTAQMPHLLESSVDAALQIHAQPFYLPDFDVILLWKRSISAIFSFIPSRYSGHQESCSCITSFTFRHEATQDYWSCNSSTFWSYLLLACPLHCT